MNEGVLGRATAEAALPSIRAPRDMAVHFSDKAKSVLSGIRAPSAVGFVVTTALRLAAETR
jgi:hypothetical protein